MGEAKKIEAAVAVESPKSAQVDHSSRGFFWFVAQGSLLKGPYSTTELKKLIDKKEVSEKYFAWRDGYREWRPLYGIEEFKGEMQEDLSYPSVPVPGAPTASNSAPEQLINKHVPIYKVRFNHSRWSDLKKSEVVFLFIGSLAFTMAILTMTFKVFENEWEKVWGKRASGILYSVGYSADAVPFYLIEPLQSAPGLVHQESHFLAVEHEANMNKKDPTDFAGFKIESASPKESFENLNWDKSNVYNRRMKVQGYIDLKNPALLHIESPGSAFEPLSSTRLTEGFAHP